MRIASDFQSIEGMSLESATEELKEKGLSLRITKINGEGCCGTCDVVVTRPEEMEAAQGRVHGRPTNGLASVLQRVDDAGVTAARDDDQPLVGVDHQGLALRDDVLHEAVR